MINPVVSFGSDLIRAYWKGKAKVEEKDKRLTPAQIFEQYCKEEPWQLECRIYDI
jgi:hypothetical protein